MVALADANPVALAAARALAPDARGSSELGEVLAAPDVDAVIIALPPALHAEAATTALARGKHIYVEKPLATTVDEARQVLAAWEGTGLVGMMGFNYRRNPIVRQACEAIAAGAIGNPVAVRTVFATPARPMAAWKQRRDSGGGALLDLAVHHIDLVRCLLGAEVDAVGARLGSLESEDDTAFVELRLTTGCVAQSFFSLSTVEEDRIEIYGSRAKLTIDRYASLRVDVSPAAAGGALGLSVKRVAREWSALPYALRKMRAPLHDPSFPAALEAFVDAVQNRTPVHPDLDDGLRAVAIIDAAERSARSGRTIALGAPADGSISRAFVDAARP